jgi:hypothetical protein
MVERKIYSSYAFKENEGEKGRMNRLIYEEDLKPKSKEFYGNNTPTEEDLKQFACYKYVGSGYAHKKYQFLSNPYNFSTLQQALICDEGDLCFGYRVEGRNIVIYTD